MVPTKPSETLAPAAIQEHILNYLPEITQLADVHFEVAFNIDSAEIQPTHWNQLAKLIYQRYEQYDGFLIIHGTDAMVYTAAALSFMLQGLNKPVVMTGSQRPLAMIRSDARSNLINSLELATYNIPEVTVFFGTRLFRGNRTIKISSTHFNAFESPNYPPLAEVGLDVVLTGKHLPPGNQFRLVTGFDREVFCFNFFPGLNREYLELLLDSPVKAVVVNALGLGNLSVEENPLIPWIEKMSEKGKVVVISSQSVHGKTDLSLYRCGKLAMDAGAVDSGDMTTSATVVKLMHLLARFEDPGTVRKKLIEPIAGEISSKRSGDSQ